MSNRDSESPDSPATRRELDQAVARVLDEMQAKERATGVLFEQMQSGQHAILEALHGFREGLQREMTELEARLMARIDMLESVVRQNSGDIRKNSEDIRSLEAAVAKLRHDFEHRDARQRLDTLESRVEELERRAGIRSRG